MYFILLLNFLSIIIQFIKCETYRIPNTVQKIDGRVFCDGKCTSSDELIIDGGVRGDLFFTEFDGVDDYITVKNDPNALVDIFSSGEEGVGVMTLINNAYLDIRGDNNKNFKYGIKMVTFLGTAIRISGTQHHIKISYIEAHFNNTNTFQGNGIQVQDSTAGSGNYIHNFEIHHNFFNGTRYSGMYLGHDKPFKNNWTCIGDFSIHDNLLTNLGSYGITLKGVCGGLNKIYRNKIKNTG